MKILSKRARLARDTQLYLKGVMMQAPIKNGPRSSYLPFLTEEPYDPTSIVEEFFFPAHPPADRGSKVEVLPGGNTFTQEQIDELVKCSTDPMHFLAKYIKVQHPTKGPTGMDFNERPYLEQLINETHSKGNVIVKHPRQAGVSHTMSAYMLWNALFKPNQCLLLGSPTHAQAVDMKSRVQFMYDTLPSWLRAGIKFSNRQGMEFDNGSQLVFSGTNEHFAKGRSYSLAYLDSFAYVKPAIQSETLQSIVPCLSTGGKLIIASTPNTTKDSFYGCWCKAEAGTSIFSPISITGWQLPQSQQDYWKQMGTAQMFREFYAEFLLP